MLFGEIYIYFFFCCCFCRRRCRSTNTCVFIFFLKYSLHTWLFVVSYTRNAAFLGFFFFSVVPFLIYRRIIHWMLCFWTYLILLLSLIWCRVSHKFVVVKFTTFFLVYAVWCWCCSFGTHSQSFTLFFSFSLKVCISYALFSLFLFADSYCLILSFSCVSHFNFRTHSVFLTVCRLPFDCFILFMFVLLTPSSLSSTSPSTVSPKIKQNISNKKLQQEYTNIIITYFFILLLFLLLAFFVCRISLNEATCNVKKVKKEKKMDRKSKYENKPISD